MALRLKLTSLSPLVKGIDHQREQLYLALSDWNIHLLCLANTTVPQQQGSHSSPALCSPHHEPPDWTMECNNSRACFQITSLWSPGHRVLCRYVLAWAQMQFRHVWACLIHWWAPPWSGPLRGQEVAPLAPSSMFPWWEQQQWGGRGGISNFEAASWTKHTKMGYRLKWGGTWERPKTDWFLT